jgi:tRNA (guanosine-2'-O-)-methyltransferase
VSALHVVERQKRFLTSSSVTRGSHRWLDVYGYPEPTAAISALAKEDYTLVAAHPEGELVPEDLAQIPRVCLVLGNEHDGVCEQLMNAATKRVRVPMRGFVDSLNVSATAAILLSHAIKGRTGNLSTDDQIRLYARGLYFTLNRAEQILQSLGVT